MAGQMANQTVITFEGLSAEAAEQLANGMVENSKAKLLELIAHASELGKMDEKSFRKFQSLVELSKDGNGGCGWSSHFGQACRCGDPALSDADLGALRRHADWVKPIEAAEQEIDDDEAE